METIENALSELDFDKLLDIVRNLNSYDGCLDYLDYWENDNEFFDTFFDTKDAAVRAVCYGDYTYTDPLVRIDVYGNCESITDYAFQDLVEGSVSDIANNLVDLWDEVDDWVKKELPEDLINLINQYKDNGESEV